MTIKEFLNELEKHKCSFSCKTGLIRHYLPTGEYYCPITLLCHKKNMGNYQTIEAYDAGKKIGLRTRQITSIMHAADFSSPVSKIRKHLLRLCK